MADNNTIARPYAQAIFDLAQENNALDLWADGLSVAKLILADGAVIEFLSKPALLNEQKLDFLCEIFTTFEEQSSLFMGENKLGFNFLKLLIENDRVSILPDVAEHFNALKLIVENSVDVTVTSAVPLDEAQKTAITLALKKRFAREIHMQTEIDETLIGGAIIRAGDVVIDGSLRSGLSGLANVLTT
jgi:F-type H+-transporting ATPase subunit delta